jgi:predicted amidohydrolase YtcJ
VNLLITQAEVAGRKVNVRIAADAIVELAPGLSPKVGEDIWRASGGALIPGLHDHHLHLHAMAAAAASVPCGPPQVRDHETLESALRTADARLGPGEWIRGVGYHESVAGDLDRHALDQLVPDRPTRIQHRGGALWMLNSRALAEIGLSWANPGDGIDADEQGHPTGRLWRADPLLRARLQTTLPDLRAIGQDLLALGVTGVTDATPDLEPKALHHLRDAVQVGILPPTVLALGAPDHWDDTGMHRGPRKLLLPDHDLPSLDDLAATVRRAHEAARAVAVHCVTRESLLLTLAALDLAGHRRGDRIEHAAVAPAEAACQIARHGIAVVTQPAFIRDRGDTYLQEVDPRDLDVLYPYASLLEAGVAVAPSSDAPFGDVDPWKAMRSAIERRTASGASLGDAERVTARAVLDGYLSTPDAPGGRPRTIVVGGPADLCLLRLPLAEALRTPDRHNVGLVIAGGRLIPA